MPGAPFASHLTKSFGWVRLFLGGNKGFDGLAVSNVSEVELLFGHHENYSLLLRDAEIMTLRARIPAAS
jgi:hypothetical protein